MKTNLWSSVREPCSDTACLYLFSGSRKLVSLEPLAWHLSQNQKFTLKEVGEVLRVWLFKTLVVAGISLFRCSNYSWSSTGFLWLGYKSKQHSSNSLPHAFILFPLKGMSTLLPPAESLLGLLNISFAEAFWGAAVMSNTTCDLMRSPWWIKQCRQRHICNVKEEAWVWFMGLW